MTRDSPSHLPDIRDGRGGKGPDRVARVSEQSPSVGALGLDVKEREVSPTAVELMGNVWRNDDSFVLLPAPSAVTQAKGGL